MTRYQTLDNSKPIRLCFLGCGKISATHARTIKSLKDEVELGFSSQNSDKATSYSKKYGGVKAYSSYDEAINDDWANVIMICIPPAFHFEWAHKVLLNNKHLILEKPAVCSVKEFDDLIQIAQERELQVMVSDNSVIGSIIAVNINAVKFQKSDGWRSDQALCPMGAMFEGGIHWLSIINNIGYKFNSIHSFFPIKSNELDKTTFVSFKTNEGPIINFLYSWEGKPLINGLGFSTVRGTKGMMRIENNGLFTWIRGKKIKILIPGLSKITGFKPMFKDIFSSLRSGNLPEYDYIKARLDIETIEKIYKSKT